jgi:type III secretion system FlhB-like substrate exporter
MNDALIAAQALKAQMEEASQREPELVLKEAGVKADRIVDRARTAESPIRRDVELLQRQFRTYVSSFRLLEGHLAEVNSIAEYELDGTIPETDEVNGDPEDDDDE